MYQKILKIIFFAIFANSAVKNILDIIILTPEFCILTTALKEMRQNKQHKSLFINALEIFDETFETNETVFQRFSVSSLIFHIVNTVFDVSFCLKSVSFSLILSHSVSFRQTLTTNFQILYTQYMIQFTKNKIGLTKRHKSLFIN